MDIIERFRTELEEGPRGLILEIAEATGIPLKTLRNLRYKETTAMRYEQMLLLEEYYARRPRAKSEART